MSTFFTNKHTHTFTVIEDSYVGILCEHTDKQIHTHTHTHTLYLRIDLKIYASSMTKQIV